MKHSGKKRCAGGNIVTGMTLYRWNDASIGFHQLRRRAARPTKRNRR